MKWLRRCAFILLAAPVAALAQTWPSKPIRLIVPYPPGGGVDYLARLMSKDLSDRLGTPLIVDNVGGANGSIGAQALARAPADGYTVMLTSDGPIVASPALTPNLPYSPLRDFVAVAMLASYTGVIVARPSFPARNVDELLSLARRKPDRVTFASAGIGNFSHLAMELMQSRSGTKMLHVPYRGTAPAIQGLLAGDVDVMFTSLSTVMDQVKAGKLAALGVGDPQRAAVLPETQSISESLPGYSYRGWAGLFAPANTPPTVVSRITREAHEFMRSPQTVRLYEQQQMASSSMTQIEFTAFIRHEQGTWVNLVKERGIKAE